MGLSWSFRADEVDPPGDNAILLISRVEASKQIKSKWRARRAYFAGAFLSFFKTALIARENAPARDQARTHIHTHTHGHGHGHAGPGFATVH